MAFCRSGWNGISNGVKKPEGDCSRTRMKQFKMLGVATTPLSACNPVPKEIR